MDHIKEYINSVGLDFPTTEQELDNFEMIYQEKKHIIPEGKVDPYDIIKRIKQKNKEQESKGKYFKRVVLAAEITYKCHSHRTFGIVKFQKLQYLCEQASNMELQGNYLKKAAGPFDNKFIHTIGNEFKKLGWFNVEKVKNNGYAKVNFTPLDNVDNYRRYYSQYFQQENEKIQYIINLFIGSKTREVELVATIFYCWQEIKIEKGIFSDRLIIKKIYAWAKEKKKFSEQDIINKISWMQTNRIYPIK